MSAVVATLLVADVIWERRRRIDWFVVAVWVGVLGFCAAGWLAFILEMRYA